MICVAAVIVGLSVGGVSAAGLVVVVIIITAQAIMHKMNHKVSVLQY